MTAFPTGSLGKDLRDTIASALLGHNTSTGSSLWVNPYENPLVPNPNLWLPSMPTCVIQKHPAHGIFNGCLVSNRTVIHAAHTSVGWPGVHYRFGNALGKTFDYVSVSRTRIAGTDIAVTMLNAEVDPSITPANLLPSSIDEILVGLNRETVPSVIVNRSRGAYLMSVKSPMTHARIGVVYENPNMLSTYTGASLDSPYNTWTYTPTNGDSGSPWLLWIKGKWHLIGCMNESQSAPAMHAYYYQIAWITGLGAAPQVTSLSDFVVPEAAVPESALEYPQDPNPPLIQTYGGGMASITVSAANLVRDMGITPTAPAQNYGNSLTNDGNVYASDNTYATVEMGGMDGEGWVYNFGVAAGALDSIPSDATIDGFLVEFEDKIVGTDGLLMASGPCDVVSLTKSSAEYGAAYNSGHVGTAQSRSAAPTSSEAYRSWGGASNLFGRTWTPAEVKSSDFKIKWAGALEYQGGGTATTYSLDHIRITVYYTAAADDDSSSSSSDSSVSSNSSSSSSSDSSLSDVSSASSNSSSSSSSESSDGPSSESSSSSSDSSDSSSSSSGVADDNSSSSSSDSSASTATSATSASSDSSSDSSASSPSSASSASSASSSSSDSGPDSSSSSDAVLLRNENRGITVFQNSSPTIEWKAYDEDGNAYSLAGRAVRLVVFSEYPTATLFTKDAVVVGNKATVTLTQANLASAGPYQYVLWDLDTDLPIATGKFEIKPAPQS